MEVTMGKKILIIGLFLLSIISAKTVPSAFFGHKDIPDSTLGNHSSQKKVLIVARESEFKRNIAHAVADSLASNSIFIIVSGVKKLKEIDPNDYSAIVIINTCLSWQIDNKVQTFFRKYPDYFNIVLLTTTGDPEGCGKGRHVPEYVDAITSASISENFMPKVNEVLKKVREFIL